MYVKDNLLKDPSYFYQLIYGDKQSKILRSYALLPNDDSFFRNTDLFDDINSKITYDANFKQVVGFSELKHIFEMHKEIVAIIKIEKDTEIIVPLKHINLNYADEKFQIETGPVLIANGFYKPAFEKSLLPAYIAFNSLDFFEYVLLDQERINENQYIRFYSKRIKQNAQIKLFSR